MQPKGSSVSACITLIHQPSFASTSQQGRFRRKQPWRLPGTSAPAVSDGTPGGHISITAFLTVPVLFGGELVGQIALADPQFAYTPDDLGRIDRSQRSSPSPSTAGGKRNESRRLSSM